jgi:serine/threonine-protein kinase
MGVVYLAQHLRLGRRVALKVLNPQLAADEVFRRRFVRESQLAASLDHPNVITIYDAGEVSGVLYISMRYVNGPGLDEVLRASKRLSPKDTLWVLEQVAAALDVAHAEGLVHRDVKPGNVLLRRRADGAGFDHVFLSDFGITKSVRGGTAQTETAQFLGTIDYTAPEQISGGRIDGRTDVYSLGCVLYQCLVGHVPYRADTLIQAMYAHLQDPPPTISGRDLPPTLDGVVHRALAKRPESRFETCTELVRASRAALGVDPGSQHWMAAPPSLRPRGAEEVTVREPRGAGPRTVTPVFAPPTIDVARAGRRRRRRLLVAGLAALTSAGLTMAALAVWRNAPATSPPTHEPPATTSRSGPPPGLGTVAWGRPLTGGLVFGGAGDQVINRAIARDDRIIAVGSDSSGADMDPAVWTFNGSDWNKSRIPAGAEAQGIAGVVEWGPRLVAVGTDYSGQDANAAVWISTEGSLWKRVSKGTLTGGGNEAVARVVGSKSGLFAVGSVRRVTGKYDATVWGSDDGRSWTVLNDLTFGGPGDQLMLGAVPFRSGVVVVGAETRRGDTDPAVWRYDGERWTRAPRSELHRPGRQQMLSVAKGQHGLVAVGFDESGPDRDAAVWTSPDGLHWNMAHAKALGGPGFQMLEGVAWTSIGYVAAGRDDPAGATWSSPAGRHWQEQPPLRYPGGFPRLAAVIEFHSKLYAFGRIRTHGQVDGAVWPGRIVRQA